MRRPENNSTLRLVLCLLIAAGLNYQVFKTLLVPVFTELDSSVLSRHSREFKEVDVVKLPNSQWQSNRNIRPALKINSRDPETTKVAKKTEPPKPPEEEKAKDRSDENKPNGQIVDVAPTPDNRPNPKAKLLSQYNTNVKKESISRDRRIDYGIAQPKPTVADFSKGRPSQDFGEKEKSEGIVLLGDPNESRRQKANQPTLRFEVPNIPRHDPLQLKLDLDKGEIATAPPMEEMRGNSNRWMIQPGSRNPSAQDGSDAEGSDGKSLALFQKPKIGDGGLMSGAPAPDHVLGVPEGEATLLNTREFKFATYFNRIKRGVGEQWGGRVGTTYLSHDPYGNVYGVKDRYTVVQVALDSEGKLSDITVAQSCGLPFLDDEAVRAFREAAPFPNPPHALLETDGRIHFQFGFYFEIGDTSGFRINRQTPY